MPIMKRRSIRNSNHKVRKYSVIYTVSHCSCISLPHITSHYIHYLSFGLQYDLIVLLNLLIPSTTPQLLIAYRHPCLLASTVRAAGAYSKIRVTSVLHLKTMEKAKVSIPTQWTLLCDAGQLTTRSYTIQPRSFYIR